MYNITMIRNTTDFPSETRRKETVSGKTVKGLKQKAVNQEFYNQWKCTSRIKAK